MAELDPNIAVVYNSGTQNTLQNQQLTQQFYTQVTFGKTVNLDLYPSNYGEYKLAGLGHPEVKNVNPPVG